MSDKAPPTRRKQCGTYTGYQYHGRAGEEACEPCTEANAEYHLAYMDANPDKKKRARIDNKNRRRAGEILKHRHWDEYKQILQQVEKGEL